MTKLARLLGLAFLACAMAALPASAQEKKKVDWIPGTTPMPNELLLDYPCHSAELPCYNYPAPEIQTVEFKGPLKGDPERGSKIANNIRWGNCFACHSLPGGIKGGTVGPDLSNYGAREMPLDYTYQRIWDTRLFNPDAHMPIYGTNKVLTDQDIQDVIAYLHTGK